MIKKWDEMEIRYQNFLYIFFIYSSKIFKVKLIKIQVKWKLWFYTTAITIH